MNADGMTVLYTTHYLEEAEQLCDRIAVIDRGKLAAIGDKEELIGQIGDVDVVRFRLPEEDDAACTAAAEGWPGFRSVRRRRGKLEIRADDGARLLPELQVWLEDGGRELHDLEVMRPNLETLYLKLTGRELRE